MANDELWQKMAHLYAPVDPDTERYFQITAARLHEEEQYRQREQAAHEFFQSSDIFNALLVGHDIDEHTKPFVVEAAARQAAERRLGTAIEPRDLGRLLDDALAEGRLHAELKVEQDAGFGDFAETIDHQDDRRTNPVPDYPNAYQTLKDNHADISAAADAVIAQQQQESDRRQSLDPGTSCIFCRCRTGKVHFGQSWSFNLRPSATPMLKANSLFIAA